MNGSANIHQSKKQAIFIEWVIDILAYIVIINIFVHYISDFFIDNFMYSLLVAFVLKAMLVLILRFEHKVAEWFDTKTEKLFSILKPLTIWTILFGSKFLILEIFDIIFGHKVDLHNIIALIFMIITMILFRKAIYFTYKKLA
jgi:hypothetical protein